MNDLYDRILPYALRAGRAAARPILQFYYVMRNEGTSTMDRILIYAAIIYTISPVSLLPAAVYRFLGVLDEGAAMLYVYKKIKDKITDEINEKVDATLNKWLCLVFYLLRLLHRILRAYSGRYPFTNSGDIRSLRW